MDVGGNLGLQLRQDCANAVHCLNDVGSGLAENNHQDRWVAVHQAGVADVFHGIPDIGYVLQADDSTGFVLRDDYVLVLVGEKELIVGRDLPGVRSVRQLAFRAIGVRGSQCGSYLLNANAQLVELHGIGFHAHRRLGAAADKHLAYTGDLRYFLRQNGVRHVIHLRQGCGLRGERHDHDGRVRRIGFAPVRPRRQIGRQLTKRRVNRGLDITGSSVNIAAQIKLQRDAGRPQSAGRCHLVDAGDASELPLQRRGYRGSHGLGAGAGQARVDLNHRVLHLRQRSYRQPRVGQCSSQQKGERKQRSCNRAPNKWSRDVHC